MRMRYALGFACSLAAFSVTAAGLHAQDRPMREREIMSAWTISDIDLLSAPSDSAASGEQNQIIRHVSSGDLVMQQRLLPEKAARLTSAIFDDDGDVLAEAGEELYGVRSGTGEVYCLARTPELNPIGALLIGAAVQASCFKDVDGDGTFDGGFKKKISTYQLPQMSGRHRRRLRVISGGDYETIAPAEMERVYFVGAEYRGRPLFGARRNFRIVFGDDNSSNSLTDYFSVRDGDYPKDVSVLGGSFAILREEDGNLDVRIDEPFAEQFFAVSISVEFR